MRFPGWKRDTLSRLYYTAVDAAKKTNLLNKQRAISQMEALDQAAQELLEQVSRQASRNGEQRH